MLRSSTIQEIDNLQSKLKLGPACPPDNTLWILFQPLSESSAEIFTQSRNTQV